MAVVKLLNLLAISCLAIIASLAPTPAAALSVEFPQPRHNLHHAIAAKKRATSSKRCRPRSTSAPAPASTPSKTSSSSKTSYAPKPTTSSSSSSGSTGGNSGSGGGKVGIAWPLGNDPTIKNFKTSKVTRYMTWSPWKVDYADDVNLEFCPMLWGSKQIGDFTKLVKPGYANCALGFNEPNQSGQSDMSPADGANLWRQYMKPLKSQGYYLVSPACTNAPSGKTWMQQFLADCSDCSVDAIATHWYGTDSKDFIAHVTDLHQTFGMKVWITEFACQNFSGGAQCSYDQVVAFMRDVTSWMDSTDYVEAYMAFGAMHDMGNVNPANQLLGGNGQPTQLGEIYIGNA